MLFHKFDCVYIYIVCVFVGRMWAIHSNVGYGDIGKSCGILAKAYGMTVIGYKRTLEKDGVAVEQLEVLYCTGTVPVFGTRIMIVIINSI